jgi:hypothetical protein
LPNPTHRSVLGVAREPTKGTSNNTPALYIPVKTFTPFDHLHLLPDEGIRGSAVMRYDQIAGPIWSEYDFGGDVYCDAIGVPLGGIFGENNALGTGGTSSTLAASSAIGATTVSSTITATTNQLIQIDVGSLAEVRKITGVSGSGPYSLTLDNALAFAHANGAATKVNTLAPFTYAFNLRNTGDLQPASFTIADRYLGLVANNTRFFSGMQFSEVAFKFNGDSLLEYTTKAMGFASAIGTDPVPSYTTVVPEAAWTGVTTIAGSGVLYMESGEITLKRKVEPVHTVDGTQAPYRIWVGPIEATGKLTFVMEDDTQLTNYLTDTTVTVDVNFSQSTPAQEQVKFHSTKAKFTTGKVVRGKDYVQIEAEVDFLGNSTDVGQSGGFGPMIVTTQNALGSILYT